MKNIDIDILKAKALEVRKHIIRMISEAGSGHPGGSLSATDLLVALFFGHMQYDAYDPFNEDRDRFVLSKGHGCPALYAVYAELGLIQFDELLSLRKLGSRLQGHPDMTRLPYLEASTGSLGQGLSIALGMALSAKLRGKSYRTYALLGDGEIDEGQVWEAAMSAPHHGISNVTAIVDFNGIQLDGFVSEIMEIAPIAEKWRAFRWNVIEIDGHDFEQILEALHQADQSTDAPTCIIAKTVKGKGVSFMENKVEFHGKAPTAEQAKAALRELEEGQG